MGTFPFIHPEHPAVGFLGTCSLCGTLCGQCCEGEMGFHPWRNVSCAVRAVLWQQCCGKRVWRSELQTGGLADGGSQTQPEVRGLSQMTDCCWGQGSAGGDVHIPVMSSTQQQNSHTTTPPPPPLCPRRRAHTRTSAIECFQRLTCFKHSSGIRLHISPAVLQQDLSGFRIDWYCISAFLVEASPEIQCFLPTWF